MATNLNDSRRRFPHRSASRGKSGARAVVVDCSSTEMNSSASHAVMSTIQEEAGFRRLNGCSDDRFGSRRGGREPIEQPRVLIDIGQAGYRFALTGLGRRVRKSCRSLRGNSGNLPSRSGC